MPSIKHSVSNVLAWAGFTFAPIALFTVIAVGIALVPQKTPPEDCESCQILTWDDVQGSPNLQRKQTQAGDWVLDNRKLIRSRPLWVINAKDFIDDFANEYEDLFLPHASLWLLAALINYVMLGSLRILPWRKIDEGEQ